MKIILVRLLLSIWLEVIWIADFRKISALIESIIGEGLLQTGFILFLVGLVTIAIPLFIWEYVNEPKK